MLGLSLVVVETRDPPDLPSLGGQERLNHKINRSFDFEDKTLEKYRLRHPGQLVDYEYFDKRSTSITNQLINLSQEHHLRVLTEMARASIGWKCVMAHSKRCDSNHDA